MTQPTPLRHIHIFGDESSHKANHDFLVYGTVNCQERHHQAVKDALEFPDVPHEFHWKKSRSHMAAHKAFINAIFECIRKNQLAFRCIYVNAKHMKHKEYNENDPDLGLEKYIFYQLLGYALEYKTGLGRFHVTLDAGREDRFPPEKKKYMLNQRYKKETETDLEPFLHVGVELSHKSRLVQAADMLAGAVAWVKNKRYLDPKKGPDKEELAKLTAAKAHLPINHPRAIAQGVERNSYLSFDYPTMPFADTKGFSIKEFDLNATENREKRATSAAQLDAIINQNARFGDLSRKYRMSLWCGNCRNDVPYQNSDERFETTRITAKYRPKCTKCGKARIPIFDPDPRDGGLLPGMIGQ